VGAKLTIAVLTAAARGRLNQTWYRRLLGATAVLLLITAGLIVWEFLPRLR
jgi:hypothetical protein